MKGPFAGRGHSLSSTGLSLHGSVCEFTLDRIDHYTVVTLSARAVLPSGSLSDRNSRRKH